MILSFRALLCNFTKISMENFGEVQRLSPVYVFGMNEKENSLVLFKTLQTGTKHEITSKSMINSGS